MYRSPTRVGAQHRHALALEAELLAGLRAVRDLHLGLAAVEGRHLELAAERRGGHRHRHAAEDVGAVALEELVRLDRQEDVEVARRPAAQARLALAGEADARAVLDAGRDVDRERALLGDAAGAAAFGQGSSITWPRPWQVGQVRSIEKKPCAARTRPWPSQVGQVVGLGAGLGAGARAGLAGDRGRHLDLGGLAGEGLLERDLEVVAQVGAALAAAALARRGGRRP